jgi:hypothetical protein
MQSAEKVCGDGDIVTCGGRVDGDDGHDLYGSAGMVVSCRLSVDMSVLSRQWNEQLRTENGQLRTAAAGS